jgi:cation diffusion facilitator family transporter
VSGSAGPGHSAASGFRSGHRVAAISVAVNATLAAANLIVGARGRSVTVLASGIEFAADVVASLAVLFGFWYASRPADSRHPYGHGRAETLTGLLMGVSLFVIGGAIALHAITDMGAIHAPPAPYTVWPLALALAVKSGLMISKMRVSRTTGSQALMADAWNDSVDVLSSVAALIALGLTLYDPVSFRAADHVGGVLVGVFVIVAGLGVVRSTSLDLIDTMPPDTLLDEVRHAACRVEGVRGVEKLFARRTGLQYHVDLHLEVDGWISVDQGHAIATEVRERIRADVHAISDVLVHVEPTGLGIPGTQEGRNAGRQERNSGGQGF